MRALRESGQWPSDDSAIAAQAAALSAPAAGAPHAATPWQALGTSRLMLGRFAEAEAALQEALKADRAQPPSEQRARIQNNLAIAIAQQGRMDEALAQFVATDSTRRALGQPEDAALLSNIAAVGLMLEDWPRARDYAARALAFDRANGQDTSLSLEALGSAHLGLGEFAKARALFEEALALPELQASSRLSLTSNLGYALLKLGDVDTAIRQLDEAARLASAAGDLRVQAIVAKNLGEAWIAKGDRHRGQRYLDDALAGEPEDALPLKRVELRRARTDNLEALGRFEDALASLRSLVEIESSLRDTETATRIAALENTLQLRARDADVERQQVEISRLEEKSRREAVERYALLGMVLSMVVILLLLIRHVRERARAHRELIERNGRIEALNALVQRQSEEDALTGLANRRHLQQVLAAIAAQEPPEPALAVVADLDHFKRVNDTWGHDAGDLVLRHVADVLRRCARRGDTLVRWGGEEFVWICHGARIEDGPRICGALRAALAASPVKIEGHTVIVTASIGFAPVRVWTEGGPMPELALKLADHAAYRAKRVGRDGWVGYVGRSAPPVSFATTGGFSAEALEDGGWISAIEEPGRS